MSDITNPYTPPAAELAIRNDEIHRLEEIRREHIKHEASIRSAGIIYYLSAFFLLLAATGLFFLYYTHSRPVDIAIAFVYLLFAAVFAIFGRALRKVSSWVRIPAAILSGIGLLGFPIGTIINGYILYLLLCNKSEMVFSTRYQEVIAQTPQIKYRTSVLVWILLALIIAGILAALLVPAFMPH